MRTRLCFAALLIPAGALGDRYGRRLSLIGGLSVFALGSLAAAFAPSTGMLIADRVVMGLGAAFVMPATLSILNAVFPPRERPQAIAAWSAVAGVGISRSARRSAASCSRHFWWGSVFLVNVPIVVVALAGVLWVVPETADPGRRSLDIVGTLLVGGALVAVVDAIIEAPTRGWTGPVTLAEAAAGLVALAIFVWWELRVENPLIDLRIFSSRAFTAASGLVTVTFFALFGSLFVFTQYLQLVHGYSPLSAGVRALPFAFAMGAVSPLSPLLGQALRQQGGDLERARAHGPRPARSVDRPCRHRYPALALAVAVMGLGMGLVMAPASSTIMTTVPAHQASAGSAVNDTVREVGGSLGVAIVGSLAAAVYRDRLGAKLIAHHAPGSVSAHRHRFCRGCRCRREEHRRFARRRARACRPRLLHDRNGLGNAGSRRRRPLGGLRRPGGLPASPAHPSREESFRGCRARRHRICA